MMFNIRQTQIASSDGFFSKQENWGVNLKDLVSEFHDMKKKIDEIHGRASDGWHYDDVPDHCGAVLIVPDRNCVDYPERWFVGCHFGRSWYKVDGGEAVLEKIYAWRELPDSPELRTVE